MGKITTIEELEAAIQLLEEKQAQEAILLKEQFEITGESLKPVNIIRGTFKDLVTAPDFKSDLVNTSISLAAGYLVKKLVFGSTNNQYKEMLGDALKIGVTSLVSQNADCIRSTLMDFLSDVLNKKEK